MKTLFLCLVTITAFAQEKPAPPSLRLPPEVRPLRYEVNLRLSPAEDSYSGTVGIDIETTKPVGAIWLNSKRINITKATVGTQSARVLEGGPEFAGLAADQPVHGKTRIDIEFTSTFEKTDTEGLFKQTEAGSSYLFTQFEPTSARRAFPCFDEPGYKVPWKLTLRIPADQVAVANTPIAGEETSGGWKTVRFNETKPMPSYLVAFAVGPFAFVDSGPAGRNKVPSRVLTPPGRTADAAYTAQVTPRIVAALEDYFGIPYPYEKLDQIAVPITVGFGAMENAGLITYNQNLILARADQDSIARQRGAASVIAHELAHQWFGNMVTPAWWDDIWLNESFATWMARKITDRLFPEWKTKASAAANRANAMELDQMVSARRIRQPIETHGDIGSAFDGITYGKGGAVLDMFENYLGTERFQRGIQAYMKKYAWRNATVREFLESISAAAGQNITAAFSSYLERGGVPLLTVELICQGKPRLQVSQQRSLPLGSRGKRDEYWPVPVCVRYGAGGKISRECVLVSDPKDEIPLKNASGCPEWVNANDQGTGYYHLLYKGDLQQRLLRHSNQLSLPEQVALLRNAQTLLRSGQMPAGEALGLAREFRNADPRLVAGALRLVTGLRRSVPDELQDRYAKLLRDWFGAKAHALGWLPKQGEDPEERLLRVELLNTMAIVGGDTELAKQAQELARKWLKDPRTLPADMVVPVLQTAAYHGDRTFYEELLAAVKKEPTRRRRGWLISAIGAFRDPAIARDALNLLLETGLDVREWTGLLSAYQSARETELLPWQFVTANYDALVRRLPSQLGRDSGTILPSAGGAFCDGAGYKQVQQFFADRIKNVSGGARALNMALERIELCAPRRTAQRSELERFLRAYGG